MKRAVRSVIRLVAAGGILIGAMYLGVEFMRYRLRSAEPGLLGTLLSVLAIVAGVVLFATSSGLAARLTDDADE